MSKDDSLRDLIERVEKATPDLQGLLLEEAWEACAADSAAFRRFACAHCSGFGTNAGRFSAALEARAYESAAIMLVPDGCEWAYLDKRAIVRAPASFSHGIGEAATPALSIVAASLRAHMGTGG